MKKLLCTFFALVLTLTIGFCFVSCDDIPEIHDGIYVDPDGGIHLPPIDYIPQ